MNSTLSAGLSDADLRAYRENGVVCLRGVLDSDWCARMHDASVRIMDRPDDQTRDTREPGGNPSTTQRRVGLSIRFFGNDARYDPRPHAMVLDRAPRVPAGGYPADDEVCPVIWERGRGLVHAG